MPNNKAGTDSTSKGTKKTVGRPNQTVAAMREQFSQEQERSKINFADAEEGLKILRDPSKSSTLSINKYSREEIRNFLQSPISNESSLRNVARYFYARSQILYRIVHWYADMWDLRCRFVSFPNYDLSTKLDMDESIKQYNDTLNQLDLYNLELQMHDPLVHCYLEDVVYFLWFRDNTGSLAYILEPDECKIDGRYLSGDFSFCIDMSKWRSQQRQALIEWIGEPLSSMWKEYNSSRNNKWVHCPEEYAGCFKFNSEFIDLVLPPLAPFFQELASLLEVNDIQAISDAQSIYKLLILPMKTIQGSKVQNDFQINPKMWLKYFDRMVQDALPDYISAAPMPGDGLEVVDFSTTAADKDIDRVENAQKNIFSTSGGGAVLNANNITSTAAFEAWLQSESDFAIGSLMGQIEGFCNRMLSYDISNPCKVEYFKLTQLTKEKFRKSFLEANQYSYSYRLALGTLYGVSEKATLASLHFEQEILGLHKLMVNPLQSSYTSTGDIDTDPVTGGRPTEDASDLSPEGDRTRNK